MNSIKAIGIILLVTVILFNIARTYANTMATAMINTISYSKAIHDVTGYIDGSYFLTYGFGVYYE